MDNILSLILVKIVFSKYFYLPICYILIGVLVYFLFCGIVDKILSHKGRHINLKKEQTVMSLIKNIIKYLLLIIVITMILSVYNINTTSIIASLSVIGVVVGLAFQDVLKNLLAGVNIIFDNHYAIGDTIEINNFKGEVIALGLQSTKIKSYTGEILTIGNSNITSVINYSNENTTLVLDIPICYEEDIQKVEDVLHKLIVKFKSIPNVLDKIELLGVESFGDSAIMYRVTVLCKPYEHFGVKRAILRIIKEEFDKNKIKIPYNQLEVYINK